MDTASAAYNDVVYLSPEDEQNESFDTNVGIVFIDENFCLKNLNKEAEKICGTDKAKAIGRKAEDIFKRCGENFAKIIPPHNETISTILKFRIQDKYTYVHADSMILHNGQNELVGMVLILQDLSSIRASVKQIQVTQMLLSLGELAAGVANFVRTPLTTISGYLQVMLGRLEEDTCAVSRSVLEMLLSEVSSINNVVKELVLFAKPPIQKEPSNNVNKLIEEALLLTFRQLGGEKIEIEKNLSANLPLVAVDSNHLKQAFVNVMQNAMEAMPQEGTLSVRSWLNSEIGMIVLAFDDTGSGIALDILSRVFEPFYTTKLEQMGLGLSVAHRIISEHGGFINISPRPSSKGTSVHIYLPIVDRHPHLRVVQQQVLNLQ